MKGETVRSGGIVPLHVEGPLPFDTPLHYNDLDAVLEAAWQCLSVGAANRRSGFHTANVATLDADGTPSIRTVVLRGCCPAARTIVFHTDARSKKVRELEIDPRVAIHVYDAQKKIQIRLAAAATLHRGNEIARHAWDRARPMSRVCYAQEASPGLAIAGAGDAAESTLDDSAAFFNFVVVEACVTSLEWLYLAAAGHRRALFEWRGGSLSQTWLAP